MNEEFNVVASNNYFVFALIMISIALLGFGISVKSYIRKGSSKLELLITMYLLGVLVQASVPLVYKLMGYPSYLDLADSISANIFTVFEYMIFCIIFYEIIEKKFLKIGIVVVATLFPLACIGYWIIERTLTKFPYHLSVIEAFLLIIICLSYLYELFILPPKRRLTQEPFFWFAVGVLSYFVCLIPTFLVLEYVEILYWSKYETLALINFMGSSLLYIAIIKTIICKTQLAKS